MAAKTAAPAPPPPPKTAATANWAEPEKAIIEKTIGASVPQPSERASTPKEIPSTSVARANGRPARAPARYCSPPAAGLPSRCLLSTFPSHERRYDGGSELVCDLPGRV